MPANPRGFLQESVIDMTALPNSAPSDLSSITLNYTAGFGNTGINPKASTPLPSGFSNGTGVGNSGAYSVTDNNARDGMKVNAQGSQYIEMNTSDSILLFSFRPLLILGAIYLLAKYVFKIRF